MLSRPSLLGAAYVGARRLITKRFAAGAANRRRFRRAAGRRDIFGLFARWLELRTNSLRWSPILTYIGRVS
jgi:hypothetical protein